MSEQDARFQAYSNVGINSAHEGKDTRFLAHSNVGINPAHEGKDSRVQAHMNVGVQTRDTTRHRSQRGWGIPLVGGRDVHVLSKDQANFHQYVEVVEPPP